MEQGHNQSIIMICLDTSLLHITLISWLLQVILIKTDLVSDNNTPLLFDSFLKWATVSVLWIIQTSCTVDERSIKPLHIVALWEAEQHLIGQNRDGQKEHGAHCHWQSECTQPQAGKRKKEKPSVKSRVSVQEFSEIRSGSASMYTQRAEWHWVTCPIWTSNKSTACWPQATTSHVDWRYVLNHSPDTSQSETVRTHCHGVS